MAILMPKDGNKSASQVLMEALEEFSQSEGRTVIVVYTNDSHEIAVKSNGRRAEVVGLLEIAKGMAIGGGNS